MGTRIKQNNESRNLLIFIYYVMMAILVNDIIFLCSVPRMAEWGYNSYGSYRGYFNIDILRFLCPFCLVLTSRGGSQMDPLKGFSDLKFKTFSACSMIMSTYFDVNWMTSSLRIYA